MSAHEIDCEHCGHTIPDFRDYDECPECGHGILEAILGTEASAGDDGNDEFADLIDADTDDLDELQEAAADQPEAFDAGRRYVEMVINGLQRQGLSPGQAWAYYGVEVRGKSRNAWGKQKGDHDHRNVSDALEKAKDKLSQ